MHISTWIFKFFWGRPSALAMCALFQRLHPPFQKSWIRLCKLWLITWKSG
jgi:hypothetical protein